MKNNDARVLLLQRIEEPRFPNFAQHRPITVDFTSASRRLVNPKRSRPPEVGVIYKGTTYKPLDLLGKIS
jgi:hypothetical protein